MAQKHINDAMEVVSNNQAVFLKVVRNLNS